jgi:type IV pilus assembly protein PilV
MMPVSKNSQSGFSLVELLVAVVILAVGLLGLAQLQLTAIKANAQSATSTAATAIAQRVIEEIVALGGDDAMFNGPNSGTWPGSPVNVEGAGSYAITYDVTQVQAGGVNVTNFFRVEVTVASTTDVMHVLGNRVRSARAFTVKRAI